LARGRLQRRDRLSKLDVPTADPVLEAGELGARVWGVYVDDAEGGGGGDRQLEEQRAPLAVCLAPVDSQRSTAGGAVVDVGAPEDGDAGVALACVQYKV